MRRTRQDERFPLVSVVIPATRIDEYLRQAVLSVLSQDAVRLEVVLVLDGVADSGSPPWLFDERIVVIRYAQRRGTPIALNLGIAVSSGQYIGRLDADDVALPGRLAAQAKFLLSNENVVCVGTAAQLIDSAGEVIGVSPAIAASRGTAQELLIRNPLVHSSVMFRAAQLREAGGYDPVMTRMQDYELYLRLAQTGDLACLPRIFTSYRVHDKQSSRNTSPWSRYTRLVLRRRAELAQIMSVSRTRQHLRNAMWFFGQVARHYGLSRARYLHGTRPAGREGSS
jgi:glycosyltransferase involved in cell wall biosynthesis